MVATISSRIVRAERARADAYALILRAQMIADDATPVCAHKRAALIRRAWLAIDLSRDVGHDSRDALRRAYYARLIARRAARI
jgi:hypothetical protein